MVREDAVGDFVSALKERFYKQAVADGRVSAAGADGAVFVSKPSPGGAILRITQKHFIS
jgi:glucose/arabinose dehydrogenase